jgi:serine protease Do
VNPAARHAGWIALAGLLLSVLLAAAPAEADPRWGWLGVRIRDLSEQEMEEISQKFGLREGFGAVIVDVIKETPAEASGLKSGDVVVAFRGRPVVDTRTLQRYIASADVGETVPMTVLRRTEGRRPVTVRLGAMPDNVVAERVAAEYGFFVRDPEPQPETGAAKPASGPAAVAGVMPKSRAATAGLKPGDVLVEIAGRAVDTVGAARDALKAVTPDGPLSIVVRRDQERIPLTLGSAKAL